MTVLSSSFSDLTGPLVLGHGIGIRADLPIPVGLAQAGAVVVLLVSVLLLGTRWRVPRFEGGRGRPMPGITRLLSAPLTRFVFRSIGVLAFLVFVAAAAFGPNDSSKNPAPTWFYVWFWIGLVPASLLLGPVWGVLNPMPVFSGAIRLLTGRDGLRPYPERLGRWPAVVGLFAFTWLELVPKGRDHPRVVLLALLVYTLAQVIGGVWFGPRWHDKADTFTTYSEYLSRMSSWRRRENGLIVAMSPMRNLAWFRAERGSVLFILVLLGSTAFDGMTRTQWWALWTRNVTGWLWVAVATASFVLIVTIALSVFHLALQSSSKSVRPEFRKTGLNLSDIFVHSLIPIAVGYLVAHYFSLFIYQGQAGYLLASDPFGMGWNLFGTEGKGFTYTIVSPALTAYVQVGAILTGHFLGILAAHDRAVGVYTPAEQKQAQYPLVAVMIMYTTLGISLLLGA